MMPNRIDADQPEKVGEALRAAHLYYLQDLTMDAIAREMHTSRSSISRLLGFARSTGLVDIQIRSPYRGSSSLEDAIQKRFQIATHIVPVPDHASNVDRLERVCMSAARMLDRYLDSNMVVGLAWGSTLTAISRHLVPKELHNVQFVQLNGAGNNQTTGIVYASEMLRRFGDAYSGTSQQFPVPAFFDDPRTKDALWRERSTRRVLDMQARMDVALFGLGSPFADVPSHVYIGGYLEPRDFAMLDEAHVVGDCATVFYRADGSYRDIHLNDRASGPDLDQLRRTPRRICVVSGASKVASLRGALAAKLVTDLVIDEGSARALLESAMSDIEHASAHMVKP